MLKLILYKSHFVYVKLNCGSVKLNLKCPAY